MTDELHCVRRISWREICPWLIILRSFRISIEVRMLVLAAVGVGLVSVGWRASEWVFDNPQPQAGWQARPWGIGIPGQGVEPWESRASHMMVAHVVGTFVAPWRHLFDPPTTFRETGYLVCGGLWTLLVWALVAGALTRLAVVRIARDERLGLFASLRHVSNKYLSYIGAPLLPIVAIVAGMIVLALLGFFMRVGFGFALVSLAWPFVLLGSFLLFILLAGLALGWPFMWTALGAEIDADSWDAVSRGYAYSLHNPLRLLGYVAVAFFQGLLGWLVVVTAIEMLLGLAGAGVTWGGGAEVATWLERPFAEVAGSPPVSWFQWIIGGWNGCVRYLGAAYGYSYFFTASSAIYLLARYDTNQTLLDEVHVSSDDDALRLPPLPSPPSV